MNLALPPGGFDVISLWCCQKCSVFSLWCCLGVVLSARGVAGGML